MAKAEVKVIIDNRALDSLLRGANGDVYRDMLRRADILQKAAKMQIKLGSGSSGPGGHLKESIVKRIEPNSSGNTLITVWVGSNHPRALMYHEGTAPHVIRGTKESGVLRFYDHGTAIYAMFVQHPGTRPNHYLTDNLPLVAN